MDSPQALIAESVRARVRRDGVDLSASPELATRYVRDEVRRYSERALGGGAPLLHDEALVARQVVAAITGLGALQPYLDDPGVEELWINAPDRVFVARDGVAERIPVELTAVEVRRLVERMLQSTGRRVDLSMPFVDASLPDGSRLHVVIPDVTRAHWSVNIRKFRRAIRSLDTLVALGSLTPLAAEFLAASVRAGVNVLVSGATQSGKTTLLGALLAAVPAGRRIVAVEETFELDLSAEDAVAMQCRQPSLQRYAQSTSWKIRLHVVEPPSEDRVPDRVRGPCPRPCPTYTAPEGGGIGTRSGITVTGHSRGRGLRRSEWCDHNEGD